MKLTIVMDDDYKPKAGDVVLVVLWDESTMFELRLMRQGDNEMTWIGHPTTGEVVDYLILEDDIFGEVVV